VTASESGEQTRLFALLVGINTYQAVNDLQGCVNDVEAMRVVLQNRYGVPDDHIRMLTDAQATRSGILQAFNEHLINNADIRRGDQMLFHYSGHGSQMPARPEDYEPDGFNETIVPHDSRVGDVYDIEDKTLAALLDELASAKGDHVTVILDCCHSGSGTRAPEDASGPRVRMVPADLRIPPPDLDADLRKPMTRNLRSTGLTAWGGLPYVLLAGCRDNELSYEYAGRLEDSVAQHGALTFFTLKTLQQLPEGATYIELYDRVAPLVNAQYPKQMPQCEGDRNRVIFDGARVQRDPFISVLKIEDVNVTLGAGLVHGMHPGTRLEIYPIEVRTTSQIHGDALATVEVTSVTATTARATVIGQPTRPLTAGDRAVIVEQSETGLRQTVRLDCVDDDIHRAALATLRAEILGPEDGKPASAYLRIEDDPGVPVDFFVVARERNVGIYSDSDRTSPLVEPIAITAEHDGAGWFSKVRLALESIVRYRTVLGLSNDTGSALNGKVRLGLRRYVTDASGQHRAEDLPSGSTSQGGELSVYIDPDTAADNLYVIDIYNDSDMRVYPTVFTLSPDYSIKQLYPNDGQVDTFGVGGGEPFPIGLAKNTSQLQLSLPDGWDSCRDYIKAIVTTTPSDLSVLTQEALTVPAPPDAARDAASTVEALIDTIAFGQGTRFAAPSKPATGQDWTVAQLAINSIREYNAVEMPASATRVALGDGLTVVKPEGFTGTVTVTTLGSATRGALADSALRPPPGLARCPDSFQLVGVPGTRALDSAGLVLGLDVDDAARRRITPDNPLKIELAPTMVAGGDELWPVAFDGEDYLPVGYGTGEDGVVNVVTLPAAVTVTGADGAPTTRGLARTLRLFIYKRMGRHTPELALRRAEVENKQVVYHPAEPGQVRHGQRVALFIHGLLSDSRWMIAQPAQFLRAEIAPYDHLLTWDYESFGTSAEDSGERLAEALTKQCGLCPNDGITVDVYAHSLGTLVARCMIELYGGHAFIDRAVLAGPPNRGSTLATTGRLLMFLATDLLNRASVVPFLGAINWPLRTLYEQGLAVADLAVDSPLTRKLNTLDEPSNVPYLVLAGENQEDEAEQNRVKRLASKVLDKGLDQVFGEVNDIAVGLSSMKGLRGGAYHLLATAILPCDHFHYFVAPEGQQAIKEWATR
jgi:pimeloyl-ACP methyl ester carboxylesterase